MILETIVKKRVEEKPKLWAIRMYARHRKLVRNRARTERISMAEVIRKSVEAYCV